MTWQDFESRIELTLINIATTPMRDFGSTFKSLRRTEHIQITAWI